MNFDGFHLPGLDTTRITQWQTLQCNDVTVRWPSLDTRQIEALWRHLADAQERVLGRTPVAEIVGAIDTAVARLEQERAETVALVSAATGYSVPVVEQTLTHMFRDWRADSLRALLEAELRDPRALDHPVADPTSHGRMVAAYGFPRALHVFSGNVPGVAVTSLIRSLLVKSATLGKTASGEPVLPVLFARALQAEAPSLAECLAVTYWPGGAGEYDAPALRSADVVVVYGGAAAIRSYGEAAEGKRAVVHGPRLSFGVVGGSPDETVAKDVAQAVAAYDQQGCVSPHLVYVLGDLARASRLAHAVGEELRTLAAELPRAALSAEEAVADRNARTAAEFAADAELIGSERDGFAVIVESDPAFRVSCLNRVLYVKPVATLKELLRLLPPPGILQSAAMSGLNEREKAELIPGLGLSGVSRITSFAQLPWPPMSWHHDGSTPLGELIHWLDIEPA